MSRKHDGYEPDDDPIDWSGFDRKDDDALTPVKGSAALAVVCLAMFVGGIVALFWGLSSCGSILEALRDTQTLDLQPLLFAGVGALTLIPAVFGLQVASKPLGFMPALVFGVVGIFIGVAAMGVIALANAEGDNLLPWPWAVLALLALLYFLCVLRVYRAASSAAAAHGSHGTHSERGVHSTRRRSAKDELWDEKNIWK